MVPTHLRWLEADAPEVLPAAARAHRWLLFAYLPLVALASIALYFFGRNVMQGDDPLVLAGGIFAAIWLVVFLPPALLGLPVALKARRALASGARDDGSRQRLRRLSLMHSLMPMLALIALVPCAYLLAAALRHAQSGGG